MIQFVQVPFNTREEFLKFMDEEGLDFDKIREMTSNELLTRIQKYKNKQKL